MVNGYKFNNLIKKNGTEKVNIFHEINLIFLKMFNVAITRNANNIGMVFELFPNALPRFLRYIGERLRRIIRRYHPEIIRVTGGGHILNI